MADSLDVLYFPFLHVKTDRIGEIRSFFSKIYLLSLPMAERSSEKNFEKMYPQNLDSVFFQKISGVLGEKVSFSGPEALRYLVSEKKEKIPSLSSLIRELSGTKVEEMEEEELKNKEGLHLAAFLLVKTESLDRITEELAKEAEETDTARKIMLQHLTGEGGGKDEGAFLRRFVPEHLDIRLRSWLRLLRDCTEVPGFWITDMPDAERLLESFFPEAERKPLPGRLAHGRDAETLFFEIPLEAPELRGLKWRSGTQDLKVLCLGCA